MGLSRPVLGLFVEQHAHYSFRGPVVTLGVQDIGATRRDLLGWCRHLDLRTDPAARVAVESGAADEPVPPRDLFALLGIAGYETIDMFPYEGASIVMDLSATLPERLVGSFGLVVDGGTLEHVFNSASALSNIVRLIAPGGCVVHISPVSGWENHGLVSINPKLLAQTYAANGFTDARAFLLHGPRDGAPTARVAPLSDLDRPFETDSRHERTLLAFFARKTAKVEPFVPPVDTHQVAPGAAPGAAPTAPPLAQRRSIVRRALGKARRAAGKIVRGARRATTGLRRPRPVPRLRDDLLQWEQDAEFNRLYELGAARCGNGPRDRYYVIAELLRSVGRLDADTAECGAFHGLGSFIMCRTAAGIPRTDAFRHHIYDSFAGLSAPVTLDAPERADVRTWHAGDMSVSEAVVRKNLADVPFLDIHAGWIPACFQGSEGLRFSFVHVDVDLHDPTRDALEFFWPRLAPRGIIVCDDYGFLTCPGAKRAMDGFVATSGAPIVRLPTGQAFLRRDA